MFPTLVDNKMVKLTDLDSHHLFFFLVLVGPIRKESQLVGVVSLD